jgi:hypothetical protein
VYRVLPHQIETCVRVAAPDCQFYFQNRDEAVSEGIATRFLHIIQIRPRYVHKVFPQAIGSQQLLLKKGFGSHQLAAISRTNMAFETGTPVGPPGLITQFN